MANIQRDLIEYSGVDTCTIKDKKNFTQLNIEEVFCIPMEKPDIEQINKVWVKGCVSCQEVVKTPIGKSIEGQILTGYKLLVCGEINLRVQYVACEATQTVHTTNSIFPFCAYVVLPADLNPNSIIKPSIIIEDVFSDQLDDRCIYNNVTLMIIVDIC